MQDTRFARRALRESEGLEGQATQGSPLRIGQPWAEFCDTFGVVIMRRFARKWDFVIETAAKCELCDQ